MIVANLALAWSVHYDRKVCCKLKHTFTIINYNPKPVIVQATGSNKHASLKHHCLYKTEMLIIMAISRMTLSRTINKSYQPHCLYKPIIVCK